MKKERSKKYRLIQVLRILVQVVFFVLFVHLLLNAHFTGEDYIKKVEVFFHFDPLLALATFIASRVMFASFVLALITVAVTTILGRVACGWVCPMGSIQQFFSFLFKKSKLHKPKRPSGNHTAWKYFILIFILVATLLSLDLVGLLDPFSFLTRSFALAVLPVFATTGSVLTGILYKLNLTSLGDSLYQFLQNLDVNTVFLQGFFLGALFIGIILLNLVRERFWCRYLCPLGALLGLLSRWNVFKLKINADKCIDCRLCTIHCETQATPFPIGDWKSSECIYCFTCGSICPTGAITFPLRFNPAKAPQVNLSRRKLLFTSFLGILAVPFFRLSAAGKRASSKLIRPPGALPEEQFLRKCVKCGECMKVCPTNALQPVMGEAGPEGIWTPMVVPKIGYCEYYCSLCTQVCPTGAIKELTIEEKVEVKIGTSWINKNRCIPWKFGDPCIVCEEHCPVSPKAIKMIKTRVELPDGTIKTPLAPVIDTGTCIGCGICENKCPVVDKPAIYVTSIGESRSDRNQFLLDVIDETGIY
ncbi:MAG: 4Fe-4S binding protein [Candidatus Aminicenantes bacterium]|nr:4Fe-4S binding protein [Candidatus Aminicenantes bacterium]